MDAVQWLLESDEPAVRKMARRDLLGEDVLSGRIVQTLLTGACADRRAYRKWTGAHWRIVSLVELEVPPGEPRAVEAAEYDLAEVLRSLEHGVGVVDGLVRRCGSVEGNTLGACSRLGLAADPRVQRLAEGLLERQRRTDGRYNAGTPWWGPVGGTRTAEIVDWGRTGPNEMVTLNALRVLKLAGR